MPLFEPKNDPPRWPSRRLAAVGLMVLALGAAWWVRAAASFSPNSQPDGWVNRVALTSYNLTSGGETLFRASYRAGEWSGALLANHINADGDIQATSPWAVPNAATALDALNWDTGRRIVSRNSLGAGIGFRWNQLSLAQQTSLGDATSGPRLLNFLRGDRSNEYPLGANLRARSTVLGDIQHSTVLHWNHGSAKRRLYVGANDGMLHVFNATTGAEVFAYVPSMLIGGLGRLAARPYSHALFVDGALAMSDVNVTTGSGASAVTSRRTWLAGALGGGGKGLFMLDMTDPEAADETAAAAKIKWEISASSSGFANLGHSYAAPRIARLNHGLAAVIVGNGYNNSGHGRASLLVINADTGALVREIDTGVGSLASPNGLSTATLVDSDGDGLVDLAYAGDIDGNLWRFNLAGNDPTAYTATRLFTPATAGSAAQALAQAIAVAPAVSPHPAGGRLVLFGTGRLLSATDTTNTAVHAVMGLWDGAPAGNTAWLTQTLTETSANGSRLRYASGNLPNWAAGGHRGWTVALPAGERLVGESPLISDGRYYFTSTNPTVAAAASGLAPGSNWLHELDVNTGGSAPASVFDINGDKQVDDADRVGGKVIIARRLGAGLYSQPALVDLAQRGLTLFNQQSGLATETAPVALAGDPGVSGGHFDVDIYYFVSGQFKDVKHTHEYDDKYDVTGVNFLNASDAAFNLGNAISSPSTNFKVLVANQYLNPAARLSVGGAAFTQVRNYGLLATSSDSAAVLAAMPVYSRSTISTLAFKLPLDAFKSKDWWGDGGSARAGLIPTQTSCVKTVGTNGTSTYPGPNGERHNGALTVQVIAANTPASALELNWPAGGPRYGWRLKLANMSYLLAEYTTFWHHPNGKCYSDAGWVLNPAQDTSAASTSTSIKAAGSTDPTDGIFTATLPGSVSVTSITTTVSAGGSTTTTVTQYSDGLRATTKVQVAGNGDITTTQTGRDGATQTTVRSIEGNNVRTVTILPDGRRRTEVVHNNADGTETVTTTDADGTVVVSLRSVGSSTVRGVEEVLAGTRRISWREIVRP